MDSFIIKELKNTDIISELEKIGFDKNYRIKAKEKYTYKNLKIFSLSLPQANILKQTALSIGADCAVHKNVITGNIEKTDVILGGSCSQLRKIADKLTFQPFNLKNLGHNIINQLEETKHKTKIVGILNITKDSFSDGGDYFETSTAQTKMKLMLEEGADIIDIGAESTKPDFIEVPAEVQLQRLLPLLKKGINISIDTRSANVAEKCLKNGAKIINDVSGLKYDPQMADIIAKYNATVVIQHSWNRQNRGENVLESQNIVDEVFLDLLKQTEYAKSRGINNIIVDVGIGFDKTYEDNFRLFNRVDEFKSLGYPIMLGISRKSFLRTNEDRDIYTLALNTLAVEKDIDYLRVHNVKLHKHLIDIYRKEIL